MKKEARPSMEAEPLPPDLPHVAYVLLWYPLFTQPFIFREVEQLKLKLPLHVFTLYGSNRRRWSQEMKASSTPVTSYGMKSLLPLLIEMGRQCALNPRKVWNIFRRSCMRPWKNWEIFGENLWAFCAGFLLAKNMREAGMDYIYAPWPRGAATAAWVASTLTGLPFGVAARGDNLAPADPDLGDKLAAAAFVRANNIADQKRIMEFSEIAADKGVELVYNSLTLPPRPNSVRAPFRNPLRLLSVGRFDVTKGFDVLLNACALLKKAGAQFRLTLAGGGGKLMGLGDLDSVLRKLRKDLDLEAEVEMPGLISHDQLPELLESHDIFIAPCVVHPSGRRDGIPNTVIEALAYAMPVVSTNVNALPEVVRNGETGISTPPNDPNALAEAIKWMMEYENEAVALGQNGAKLARELFDPAMNAQKLSDIFIRQAERS